MNSLPLEISAAGEIHALYHDQIPWKSLGSCSIRRASHVEPTEEGTWCADLAPVHGPCLGPFATRGDALQAEQEWLSRHLSRIASL